MTKDLTHPNTLVETITEMLQSQHEHAAAERKVTHTFKEHGYHRQVQTCSCGARRTVTKDDALLPADYTQWAQPESVLCG